MIHKYQLIMLILTVAITCNAKVITYTKSFDIFKTVYPAKSEQIKCRTDVDIEEGLVHNYNCKVIEIQVFNKDGLWIGDLTNEIDTYTYVNNAFYDYTERYARKGKNIKVIYDVTEEAADEDCIDCYVTCPKGKIPYINGEYYACKEPYSCGNYEYAVDKINCEVLPENSHRNKTIGWQCDKNYIPVNGSCEKKASCYADQLYDKSLNECFGLIEHSHWVDSATHKWECDSNYTYIEALAECQIQAECSTLQFYDITYNKCINPPLHGKFNRFGNEVECDSGYRYIARYNICRVIPDCPSGARYDDNNSCLYDSEENYIYDSFVEAKNDNEINITFSHSLGGEIAYGIVDEDEGMKNLPMLYSLDYCAGLMVGNDELNVKLQFAISGSWLIFEEYNNNNGWLETEWVFNPLILYGFNLGIDLFKFSFDYTYLYNTKEKLSETIFRRKSMHKIKIGINTSEQWTVYFAYIVPFFKTEIHNIDETWISMGIYYTF